MFFFLFPSHVFSEWNVIAENEEAKIFVDPGSIRKVDKGVKSIWALKNFKKDNRKINSRQFKLEFDCENDEFRRMIRVSFSGHFSSGLPIKDYFKPEDWRSIDDDELFKALFQKTCKKIN
ncbi:MAG: hypothetical protein CMP38_07135 [Rickettsiales bacterium]|nr:hypothetical protein [Rickettsiales bacterium]